MERVGWARRGVLLDGWRLPAGEVPTGDLLAGHATVWSAAELAGPELRERLALRAAANEFQSGEVDKARKRIASAPPAAARLSGAEPHNLSTILGGGGRAAIPASLYAMYQLPAGLPNLLAVVDAFYAPSAWAPSDAAEAGARIKDFLNFIGTFISDDHPDAADHVRDRVRARTVLLDAAVPGVLPTATVASARRNVEGETIDALESWIQLRDPGNVQLVDRLCAWFGCPKQNLLHPAVHPRDQMARLTLLPWSQLDALDAGRLQPSLHSFSALFLGFRSTVEVAAHHLLVLPYGEFAPGDTVMREFVRDRRSFGAGRLASLLLDMSAGKVAAPMRPFAGWIESRPWLTPLRSPSSINGLRGLLAMNLNGLPHKEEVARGDWRRLFAGVRRDLYGDLQWSAEEKDGPPTRRGAVGALLDAFDLREHA